MPCRGARPHPAPGGLWLDHTLGPAHAREGRAARHPAGRAREGHRRARGLHGRACRSRRGCRARCAMAADRPWWCWCSLHPIMGAVAAVCAPAPRAVVTLSAGPPRCGAWREQVDQARKGTATWWLAATLAGRARLPAGAADEWEQLDRAHIAAAYALGKRQRSCRTLARLVRLGGADRIDLGRRLAGHPPRAVAGRALRLRAPRRLADGVAWKRLVSSLPRRGPAMAAYRQLRALPRRCAQRSGCARAAALRPLRAAPQRQGTAWRLGSPAILLFIAAGAGRKLTPGSATSRG